MHNLKQIKNIFFSAKENFFRFLTFFHKKRSNRKPNKKISHVSIPQKRKQKTNLYPFPGPNPVQKHVNISRHSNFGNNLKNQQTIKVQRKKSPKNNNSRQLLDFEVKSSNRYVLPKKNKKKLCVVGIITTSLSEAFAKLSIEILSLFISFQMFI